MKFKRIRLVAFFIFTIFLTINCKESARKILQTAHNEIVDAKGFSLYRYDGFSVMTVQNPYPGSNSQKMYVLAKNRNAVPDTLTEKTFIQIPVNRIAVSSTTHIPSLVMLNATNCLTAFPNTDYISSPIVRSRIALGKIADLGNNQDLNVEKLMQSQAEIFVAYQIDSSRNIEKKLAATGVEYVLNGDWNEQTALGKAEYIKFFGALLGKDALAQRIFDGIKKSYLQTKKMVAHVKNKPSVMAGAMFEDRWYLPYGNSWGATFIEDAGANYVYSKTNGTGSLNYDYEQVFADCKNVTFWIGPGQFTSRNEMMQSNEKYAAFQSFASDRVYSYSVRKGATGGILFYELAPNRPDLVLKDFVKIFHPDLLPKHSPYFIQKLSQ